jgi:hypothetical protein
MKINFIVCFLIHSVNSLPPFKNNGNIRKYYPNKKCPAEDLKVITLQEASIISRHWLSNIVVDNIIKPEDQYIVEKINDAEQYFQNQFTELSKYNDLYLAWAPKGDVNQILFIVFSCVDHENRKLIINMVIPCPYWESKQISANELKKALESLASESDADLDLQPLYDSDIRIKMDWTYFN